MSSQAATAVNPEQRPVLTVAETHQSRESLAAVSNASAGNPEIADTSPAFCLTDTRLRIDNAGRTAESGEPERA